MQKAKIAFLFIIALAGLSCQHAPEKSKVTAIAPKDTVISGETLIAKNIIYDVVLKNPDPTNEWKDSCLKGLDRDALTKRLFDAVLSGKVIAYDFSNNSPCPIPDIKKLTKDSEFKNSKIAMAQFEETWYLDTVAFGLRKHVDAIIFGYETYNSDGELKGYKSLFKVYLDNTK